MNWPSRRRRIASLTAAFLLGEIVLAFLAPQIGAVFDAQAAPAALSISRTQSGYISSDSLTTGDTGRWVFGGSAVGENAPYRYYEDSSGLHIGVEASNAGEWAGYYAVTPQTNSGYLYHAVLTLPYSTVPGGSFNTGLYVQTATPGMIDYVTCVAGADSQGYYWSVVQASGSGTSASHFNTLYFQWMNNQPLTRDCTIVTNGSNTLKVYLDGQLVYSSNSLTLNMPAPFHAFLEVQTTYPGQLLYGNYKDYYTAQSDFVTVSNAPAGSTVRVVDSSNRVLASSAAGSDGNARLDIGGYHLPLNAYIIVSEFGSTLASTQGAVDIWGGDAYSVGSTPTSTSNTSTSTTTTTSPTPSTTSTVTSATTPIVSSTSSSTTTSTTSTTATSQGSTTTSTTTTQTVICLPVVGCL